MTIMISLVTKSSTFNDHWYIYFSRPTNDAQWIHFDKRGSQSFDSNATIRFGDTNGDGKINLLTSTGSTWKEYSNRKGIKEYVISSIVNGNGISTNISYKPMTNNSVYVFQSSDENIDSDTFSPLSGASLVNMVSTDSNTGKSVRVSYQYGGLLIHKKGRGSLGFQMLRTEDEQTGVISETHYNQSHGATDFAMARMPIYSEQRLNGQLLSMATNTLAVMPTKQGGVLPYISQSNEKSYVYGTDNMSTQINNTVTTNTYDSWGNLDYSTVLITDSSTYQTIETITDNDFGNDVEQQFGRLQRTTVRKKRTGDVEYSVRDTTFTYNSDMLLSGSILSPNNNTTKVTTTYGYDAYGNKISVGVTGYSTATGNSQTRTSKTDYQKYGRYLHYKQNALNEKVTYKYNGYAATSASGLTTALTQTSANGISTTTYTENMSPVSVIDHADSRTTTITNSFCTTGCIANAYYKVLKEVTGSPDSEAYFDKWGRKIGSAVAAFEGGWYISTSEYDAWGRKVKDFEPGVNGASSYFTEYIYDNADLWPGKLGRVTQIKKSNDGIVSTRIFGLETQTTNELGNISKTFSNGFGETTSTEDALGNRVIFTYDTYGNLTKSTTSAEGKNSEVKAEYDTWGRKIKTIDPIKGTWHYTYNAFGELYSQTTAKGQTFTFTYDLLGRKIRSYEANEGTLCWNYGSTGLASIKAAGKIISTAKYASSNVACTTSATPSIKKSITYDSLGRSKDVITTIGASTYTQSQSYDSYSRPLVTTYPAGTSSFAIKNNYNSNGYLFKQINNATGNSYKRIDAMSPRGKVTEVTLGNGVTTTYD